MAANAGAAGCVFCDIVAGRGPASVGHSDETVLAFLDIRPLNTGRGVTGALASPAQPVSSRIRPLPMSAISTSPAPFTATSDAWATSALVPGPPSPEKPRTPVPATV
jgi:hypothetical protein